MIPRYTDVEQFFSINAEDGMITTTKPLDRETQPWHNISVSATEIGTYALKPTATGTDSERASIDLLNIACKHRHTNYYVHITSTFRCVRGL